MSMLEWCWVEGLVDTDSSHYRSTFFFFPVTLNYSSFKRMRVSIHANFSWSPDLFVHEYCFFFLPEQLIKFAIVKFADQSPCSLISNFHLISTAYLLTNVPVCCGRKSQWSTISSREMKCQKSDAILKKRDLYFNRWFTIHVHKLNYRFYSCDQFENAWDRSSSEIRFVTLEDIVSQNV